MAGNRVGRPRVDDPKVKIPSLRIKQSTLIELEYLSEKLHKTRSEILQLLVENGLNIVKKITD